VTRAVRPSFRLASGLLALSAAFLGGCDEKNLVNTDRTPPEVSISSPSAADTVSGVTFVVEATATDDVALDRVELLVNGALAGVDTTAPHRLLVFTLQFAEGASLTVTARAVDAAENASTASVELTVSARTTTPLTSSPTEDRNPSWSPDGTSIAFEARRPDGHLDIWKMDADGGNQTRLTTNTNDDRNPAWSPSGDVIAFDSNRAGTFDIWRMPAASGESGATVADSLTFGNEDDVEPAWSPDGTTIWFASNRGDNAPYNLWSVPAAGGAQTQVTSFESDQTSPAASPDGLFLAFSSNLNVQTPKIYTMRIGSTDVTLLTSAPIAETEPSWDPTSTALLYTRTDGSGSRVWGVPAQGGVAPTQITFGIEDGGAVFSPDASRIAFHSSRDGDPEIYVLE
jgi:TolB protein